MFTARSALSSYMQIFKWWPVFADVRIRSLATSCKIFVYTVAHKQFSIPGLRFSPASIIRQRSILTAILNTIGRILETFEQSSLVLCEISGGAAEAFALVGPYGTYNGLEAIRRALGSKITSHRTAGRSRQTLHAVVICTQHITNFHSTRENVVSFRLSWK